MLDRMGDRTTGRAPRERDVQLVRLTENDEIEAYLTKFERVMEAYEVDKSRWAFKLAPYLSGKVQQAYASLPSEEAAEYERVKDTILRRYDITEETYRQLSSRFSEDSKVSIRGLLRLAPPRLVKCDDSVLINDLMKSNCQDMKASF